jgi:autotransporter-associated beta strand protein
LLFAPRPCVRSPATFFLAMRPSHLPRRLFLSLVCLAALTACGGGGSDAPAEEPGLDLPAPPAGLGRVDTAPVPDETAVPPFVDFSYTNQRGDARYATLETNAGVRVLAGFLDLWTPTTLLVDAGVTAAAVDGFPAVTPSTWSGVPGVAPDGTKRNAAVLDANIQYVVDATVQRTPAQAVMAYMDDRRHKAYSMTDGMGPLRSAWLAATGQVTTIADIPADATTVRYDDGGNDVGVRGAANPAFGTVVDFIGAIGENGSTEPAKRFYKYARPWRWSTSVVVVPTLEPAKSSTPATDGGFTSGHSAEAVRRALAMAYVVPERYQELLSRALEMGESRILAGMHSPLDVISGRMQSTAVAVSSMAGTQPGTGGNAARKAAAFEQARSVLMAAVGAQTPAQLQTFAHSQGAADDRFADHATNRAEYLRRLTFGFAPIGGTTRPAVVPKSAEVLLETRLPYLDAAQRRVVLKTTALPSGYPVMDDAEGWGRLNLFAAADGYGAFDGDVTVAMDAAQLGFHALDTWRNDIGGAGKLTKTGTGTLRLAGNNRYAGGTHLVAGSLQADSASAFGLGSVHVEGGTLVSSAPAALVITGAYTQLAGGSLALNLGSAGAGRLTVTGTATLAGGALTVRFLPGFKPVVGDTLTILNAGGVTGVFGPIQVEGFTTVTPVYTPTAVLLRLDA